MGAFVGCGEEFQSHSTFSGKLVTDFNQASDAIGLEFLTLCWLNDMERIGRCPEKK